MILIGGEFMIVRKGLYSSFKENSIYNFSLNFFWDKFKTTCTYKNESISSAQDNKKQHMNIPLVDHKANSMM